MDRSSRPIHRHQRPNLPLLLCLHLNPRRQQPPQHPGHWPRQRRCTHHCARRHRLVRPPRCLFKRLCSKQSASNHLPHLLLLQRSHHVDAPWRRVVHLLQSVQATSRFNESAGTPAQYVFPAASVSICFAALGVFDATALVGVAKPVCSFGRVV